MRSSTPTPEEELEALNQMSNSRLAVNFAQAQFNGKIRQNLVVEMRVKTSILNTFISKQYINKMSSTN